MNSVKLLLLTHKFYPNIGGTESNAEFISNVFHDYGFNVHVVTWTSEFGSKNFPYTVIRNPSMLKLISEHRWADIVFENSPVLRLSWPAVLIKRPLMVVINTWLDSEDGHNAIISKIKIAWLRKANTVIAVSEAIRKRSYLRAEVIENAYNDRLFINKKRIEDRKKAFVFLGRLVSDKGVNIAIEAIYKLRNRVHPSVREYGLTIIGDGIEIEQLQRLTNSLQLGDLVNFVGALSGTSLVSVLNEHRFLLVPSVWDEPFGIVALEGMACGCIPFVSASGGLPDAVGDAGVVFNKGDVGHLVDKMVALIDNPELETTIRNNSKMHLMAHSPQEIGEKYRNAVLTTIDKFKFSENTLHSS